jgi:hypothetical protein
MWRMCMSVLVSGWIFTTPVLWAHRWEQAVLSVLVGLLGVALSPAAIVWPRLERAVFALGALRALSTFVLPDTFATNVDNLSTGLLLVIAGMYPRMQVIPARVPAVAPRTNDVAPPRERMAA